MRLTQVANTEVSRQAIRYGIVGIGLAFLYAGTYFVAATLLMVAAQAANFIGFALALVTGYWLHSRWSFREGGTIGQWSWSRFLMVNLLGYALNCLWVWLLVDLLGCPAWQAIIPIVTLTPMFTFLLNRLWTFA